MRGYRSWVLTKHAVDSLYFVFPLGDQQGPTDANANEFRPSRYGISVTSVVQGGRGAMLLRAYGAYKASNAYNVG